MTRARKMGGKGGGRSAAGYKGHSDVSFRLDGKRFPYQNAGCLRFNSPTGFLRLIIPSSNSVPGSIALIAGQFQLESTTPFQWLTSRRQTVGGILRLLRKLVHKRQLADCVTVPSSTSEDLIRSSKGANSFPIACAVWRSVRQVSGATEKFSGFMAPFKISSNSSKRKSPIYSREPTGSMDGSIIQTLRTCFMSLC